MRRAGRTVGSVIVALVLGSCGFTGDLSRFGDDVLVMSNLAEPGSLDPALQSGVEEQRITLALFEGLLSYDPKTLRPRPGLAERWDVSRDGKTWTFHLRPSTWSDGRSLTSADFVYAWRRVLDPPGTHREGSADYAVASPYADLMDVIVGARKYRRGEVDDFAAVGLATPDSQTLEVHLEQATPWFADLVCFPTFMPVPRHVVEHERERWTHAGVMVSNGPFVLDERRPGAFLRVRKNPRYWDAETVRLESLVYLSTDRVDTALDQYLAGESDWVRGFNPLKARAWRADPELGRALHAPDYLGTYFLRFNVRRPPLDDVRVRQALTLAVDREAITRNLTAMGEKPATGIMPPCLVTDPPWRSLRGRGLDHDPHRARALLAAAGFPAGKGFPLLTYSFNSDVKNRAIAEAIQAMWKDVLGIRVELLNREKRVHLARERAGDYDISRGSWIGDFNDPVTFLDFMRSGAGNNRTGWSSRRFDELLDAARTESDSAQRIALLQAAEEILMVDEAPLLPIFHFTTAYVLRPGRFAGIFENARDLHPPKFIRRLP